MRKKGSFYEHEEERNSDLMEVYKKCLASMTYVSMARLWELMAEYPAKRFYVSEERAAIVVSRIFHGDNLSNMRPTRRKMFYEIHSRVQKIIQDKPQLSIAQCCSMIVYSPAPSFFMTPFSIRQTVYKIKRQWYEQRRNRIYHLAL